MYNTTTGTYQAILTRYGRQVLADNSSVFKITKYMFSDDEIDYSQFIAEDSANDRAILNTPILEPCSLGNSPAQRYSLISLGSGAQQVSRLDSDWGWINGKPTRPFIDGYQEIRTSNTDSNGIPRCGGIIRIDNGEIRFQIRTLYGYDSKYNIVSSNPEVVPYTELNLLLGGQMQHQGTYNCTDPYEVWQHQSQAGYVLNIAPGVISGEQQVNISSEKVLLENIDGSGVFYENGIQPYLQNQMVSMQFQGGLQTVDLTPKYGKVKNVGMCGTTLTIQGIDTGNKIFIDILIYDPLIWKIK